MKPKSGLLFDIFTPFIVMLPLSVSPGLTGWGHSISSCPGEPKVTSYDKNFSCIILSQIKAVSHPLEMMPPKIVSLAFASST